MTATDLGLGGNPVKLFGAYVISVTTNLGLQQSPSTANVTLVEDLNVSPQVLFNAPEMGTYTTLQVGSNYTFAGVVTRYEEDLSNISGKVITVDISDPREIMNSVPMIMAPGFREVVDTIDDTGCSLIDVYGAYDDFGNTGINLSGWNQTGIIYKNIALVLNGGVTNDPGFTFKVPRQTANVFGEQYRFNISEVSAVVDDLHRVNSNLISIANFIQELANRYAFDWYAESSRAEDNIIDVVIKVIDRSTDNVDLDLDTFLANNSGAVISAKRGFELRNELACSVLFGAPVEQLRQLNITGLANNPIDLSDEGGSDKYYMVENEMRMVLGNKAGWKTWVHGNGGFARYTITGLASTPIITPGSFNDITASQLGVSTAALLTTEADEDTQGRLYDKLKGHAEATYGKRFLFQQPTDVDYVDAAWTVDLIAGNNDPNEYFRNSQGKTRAYVEFINGGGIIGDPDAGVFGYSGNFGFGKGDNAAQALELDLSTEFLVTKALTQSDKADWIIKGGSLYVSATIEEGNIIKLDNPVIFHLPDTQEIQGEIETAVPGVSTKRMFGADRTQGDTIRQNRGQMHGTEGSYSEIHAKAYQPRYVYVPVRSKFNRYGPVFPSGVGADSEGKLDIEQDDGFAPWEFGGTSLMVTAMQFKVNNSTSTVKTVESADITLEGFPEFSIGQSLGDNSNINNISINLTGQVTTSYRLQSFLRRFGELSKDELAALSLYARRGGNMVLPQNSIDFIDKHRTQIARQFGGRGSSNSSATTGGAGSFE